MIELRRVRFATIDGLQRQDLPLASEIWRDDLFAAPWATREAMKLANHFVRYMSNPRPDSLILSEIERHYLLLADDVARTLAAMRAYGAIDEYSIEFGDVRVALNLTLLQRLRTLEARQTLIRLLGRPNLQTSPGAPWMPRPNLDLVTADPTAADPMPA